MKWIQFNAANFIAAINLMNEWINFFLLICRFTSLFQFGGKWTDTEVHFYQRQFFSHSFLQVGFLFSVSLFICFERIWAWVAFEARHRFKLHIKQRMKKERQPDYLFKQTYFINEIQLKWMKQSGMKFNLIEWLPSLTLSSRY